MADKNKMKTTWIVLFGTAAILFFFIGIAKIFADGKIFEGAQYLFSTVLLWAYLSLIRRNKVDPTGSKNSFALGFIFTVVGLNLNIGIWGLGIVLLLFGLPRKK